MIELYAELVKLNLNWSQEVIVGFFSVIPMAIAFLLILNNYVKENYRHSLYLAMGWGSMTFWCFFQAFSILILSKTIFILSLTFLVFAGFSIILLMDSVNRESIDPIKLFLMTVVSTAVIIFSLEPNSVVYYLSRYGDVGMFMEGNYLIAVFALILLLGFLYFYYMAKIHLNAPKNLRNYSGLNLFGGIMAGIVTPLSVILLDDIFPGSNMPMAAAGALMITIAFLYQPKLAFILPFKASRLTVIEIKSGIPFYTYTWSKTEGILDETLFSGMMYAVSQILEESIQKGNIREINLEEAILILQRSEDYPAVCVLITNKSSKALRQALNSFAEKFFNEYSQFITEPIDQNAFKTASKLVLEAFPFLPAYD